MAKEKISYLVTKAKRESIDGGILNNVDLANDLIVTPKELFSQFIPEESLPLYEKMISELQLNKPISLDTLNNEDFSKILMDIKNGIISYKIPDYDARLLNITRFKGNDLFIEQFQLSFSNVNDIEFQEIYKDFILDIKKNNPSSLVFVSKSDNTRTITYSTSTKIIKSISPSEPLLSSYGQRGGGDPYQTSIKNASNKNASNPNYDFFVKTLFRVFDKNNIDLIVGNNPNYRTKLDFFEEAELTKEEIEFAEFFKKSVVDSKNVDAFNNNVTRGSMSPNSTKEYVEKKEINEDIVSLDKETKEKMEILISSPSKTPIEELEDKKALLKIDMEKLLKEGESTKAGQIAGKMFNITQKIKQLEKMALNALDKETKTEEFLSPLESKDISEIKEEFKEEFKEDKKESSLALPDGTISLTGEIIDKELASILNQELLSISIANTKKIESAPSLAKSMLEEFKVLFDQGGSVVSNVEKINQKYRDNTFAFEIFNAMLKYELKASLIKDRAIVTLNENIIKKEQESLLIKDKYNKKISELSSNIKSLQESTEIFEEKYEELSKEFISYENATTPKLEEYRNKLEDYENIKATDEAKNELIEKLDTLSSGLEKENTQYKKKIVNLEDKVSNYSDLKELNTTQKSIIDTLKEENIKLRNDFNLSTQTVFQLEAQLAQFKKMNEKLQEELKIVDSKILLGNEIKKEVVEQSKTLKILEKKEETLEKTNKKIESLTPILKEELRQAIDNEPYNSVGWHRLSMVSAGRLNLTALKAKSPDDIFSACNDVANELITSNLAYMIDKDSIVIKDNAKRVIFENPRADITQLKDAFQEVQELHREDYTKPQQKESVSNGTPQGKNTYRVRN